MGNGHGAYTIFFLVRRRLLDCDDEKDIPVCEAEKHPFALIWKIRSVHGYIYI